MVGVPVTRHHQGDPRHAAPPQEGHHDPPTGVARPAARAAIDHDPLAARRAQHSGVPLPDVEEMYGQAGAGVEGNVAHDESPEDDRDQERPTRHRHPSVAAHHPDPAERRRHPRPHRPALPPLRRHRVSPWRRRGEPGHQVEQREREPRAGGEEVRDRRGDAREGEGREQPRNRNAAERDRHEVGEDADRRDGSERERRDRRGEQGRGSARREGADQLWPARERAPGPEDAADGRHREPRADGPQRPRIEHEQDQDREAD